MNIFISWSGEVSKNIANLLKKWIPHFFESVEVFFSPEDIEKGQNWNKRITEELANCNYGIVCLTTDNKSAPWINFEAGAIANAFDSKVTALLVDVNPSDIQGPLSMFQATKLDKDDIYNLFRGINRNTEKPRDEETLRSLFNLLWGKMDEDFHNVIESTSTKTKVKEKVDQDEILESILLAVREQGRMLSDPENILPLKYFYKIIGETKTFGYDALTKYIRFILLKTLDILSANSKKAETNKNIKLIVLQTMNILREQQINDMAINKMLFYISQEIDDIFNEYDIQQAEL